MDNLLSLPVLYSPKRKAQLRDQLGEELSLSLPARLTYLDATIEAALILNEELLGDLASH